MKSLLVLVLTAWLGCLGALAQPMAVTAASSINTREECTARGGAWLASRGSWQGACQMPWDREECLHLGGGWTPMSAAPAGGICMAQVAPAALAQQCAQAGGTWGPPGSAMPFCTPGTAVAQVPVRVAPDANHACGNQLDCVYGCVYGGPPVPVGTTVAGQCRATSKVEGCYSMVENGRLSGSICMK